MTEERCFRTVLWCDRRLQHQRRWNCTWAELSRRSASTGKSFSTYKCGRPATRRSTEGRGEGEREGGRKGGREGGSG